MPHDTPALLGGVPVRPDGPPIWPRRTAETDAVLQSLRESGDWGRYHGPHSVQLISAISKSLQLEHAQLCASGTAAVELALRGVSVGPGDEVILSAYDFKANFTNVVLLVRCPYWSTAGRMMLNSMSRRSKRLVLKRRRRSSPRTYRAGWWTCQHCARLPTGVGSRSSRMCARFLEQWSRDDQRGRGAMWRRSVSGDRNSSLRDAEERC